MEVQCERKYQLAYLLFSMLVHTLGLFNFSAVISLRMYYDMANCKQDYFMKFGYSFKYGSLLNATCQLIYNLIALMVDLMTFSSYTQDAPPRWLTVRSFIRSTIALPFGFYTCARFWLFTWLKLKIMGVDCYPNWFRHFLFTVNPFLLICDVFCCKGDAPGSIVALVVINILCSMYFVWLHVIYQFTGVWAVAFIKDFTFPGKLVGYIFIALTVYINFLIGKLLNNILWNEEYVSHIPCLSDYVSAPPRFVYGYPSKDSATFGKYLSGTASMFIDRPNKKKTPK
ncbi:androgen-induced gene 1 protein-like [Cimex lectularius]|uniref:Uncharacterized protein n=1 Tax=Cimex lectularius TaxID=79782 RepID=A0A8I6SJ92_CIMLE|nr:androgen-induced gene 1 protein-like [Cimex lectularius]